MVPVGGWPTVPGPRGGLTGWANGVISGITSGVGREADGGGGMIFDILRKSGIRLRQGCGATRAEKREAETGTQRQQASAAAEALAAKLGMGLRGRIGRMGRHVGPEWSKWIRLSPGMTVIANRQSPITRTLKSD